MKRLLLIGALIGAMLAPAAAQINTVASTGLTTGYLGRSTYSAAFFGLVPAASATDVVCIAGSATKTVKVMNIKISGSAGTLVSLPLVLLRRVTVDTGGTAGTTTANPANTISKRDTTIGTASAVPISYTANPTITDSAPTYIDSVMVTLPTTAAGTVIVPAVFDFGKDVENFLQPPILVGVAAQICVNLGAVSVSSGVLNGSITWTEE